MSSPRRLALLLLLAATALAGCATHGEAVGPPGYRPAPGPGFYSGAGGGPSPGSSGRRSSAPSGGNSYAQSGMPLGASPAAGAVLFSGI